eukprot:scaffold8204_cov248-Pinguiococcus_pyrenoidosus.AAC.3
MTDFGTALKEVPRASSGSGSGSGLGSASLPLACSAADPVAVSRRRNPRGGTTRSSVQLSMSVPRCSATRVPPCP